MEWVKRALRLGPLLGFAAALDLTPAAAQAPTLSRSELPQWNGEGEVFIRPDPLDAGFGFTIGAVFDAGGGCAEKVSTFPAYLTGSGIRLLTPYPDSTRLISSFRSPERFLFRESHCRFEITPRVAIQRDGVWTDVEGFKPPPTPPATGRVQGLNLEGKPNVGIFETDERLASWRPPKEIRWIGGYNAYFPMANGACPEGGAELFINPTGVYVSMAWATAKGFSPGIRRDEARKTTTLLFVSSECRLELIVRKEVLADGNWISANLAPKPIPVGKQ